MAISFVNSAKTGSATVTLPTGIQVNDIIVLFGYRNTTTAPSLPTGYTNISNTSGNSNSARVCYKVADGTESGTNVTMTNANVIQCAVYRGCYVTGGQGIQTNAASTTTNLAASSAFSVGDGTSWGVYYCGSRQTTSQSTPAGTTIRGATQTGTTSIAGIFDTNGGVTSNAAKTSTAGASATGAGGSFELVATIAASTFTDNFNDNSFDSRWDPGAIGAGTTTLETNQRFEQSPGASVGGAESYMDAGGFTPKWNLVGNAFYVKLIQALNANAFDTNTIINIIPNDHYNLYFSIRDSPQNIYAGIVTADVDTTLASAAYDPNTHQWLRIRESGGTIFWDTRTDHTDWVNFASSAPAWSPVSVYPKFQALANNVASPGQAIWDNFNVYPGGYPFPKKWSRNTLIRM